MSRDYQLSHDALFVSGVVRRGLGYLPKQDGQTSDHIADQVLMAWLAANHPEIMAHIRSRDEADKEFREKMKKVLQ